jgi:hypothetical protein
MGRFAGGAYGLKYRRETVFVGHRLILSKGRRIEGLGYLSPVPVASSWVAWTRASFRAGGNSFPRLSALLNIPAQAFGLKKYRRGRSPISKISDKYASAASLRDSEVFSVKRSVGDMIPEFSQRPDKGGEICASGLTGRIDAWHVFPYNPSGSVLFNKASICESDAAARIVEAQSLSGNGPGLAGGSPDDEVHISNW